MSAKKIGILLFLLSAVVSIYADQVIILATTTSVYDSGLLDKLLPEFEKKYHCQVKVVAAGSGQALRLGQDGNADVLLVHDPEAEEEFIQKGYGTKRYPVATNDFIIVGPSNDPLGLKKAAGVREAFQLIAKSSFPFVSRGDDSGTHKKELSIWKTIFRSKSDFAGKFWYWESGSGMELTLRIADEKNAYCLTDRSTWLAHQKEFSNLKICFSDDRMLTNYYSVIPVSPQYSRGNYSLAKKFVDFITGPAGQKIIQDFGRDLFGQPLFHPVKPVN